MCKRLTDVGIDRIKQIISNRYPYLLIDKAVEIVPGVSARGYKNMTANEWFFPVHFQEEPMMPGMIQMEALLQMLSLCVLTMDTNHGAVLQGVSANKIRLKKRIVPGCCLDIEAELVSLEDDVAVGRAKGMVDNEEVCSAEFTAHVIKERGDINAE